MCNREVNNDSKTLFKHNQFLDCVCVCVCVCVCMCVHAQPLDCSLPDSSAHGIFQARILEWGAISYSGDLPDPGIEHMSPESPAMVVGFFTTEPPGSPS